MCRDRKSERTIQGLSRLSYPGALSLSFRACLGPTSSRSPLPTLMETSLQKGSSTHVIVKIHLSTLSSMLDKRSSKLFYIFPCQFMKYWVGQKVHLVSSIKRKTHFCILTKNFIHLDILSMSAVSHVV